ncbi:hypothetical protein DH2020_021830 [Rehmannia glutinosa]|uniref:Fe2OG dioxygenase domain-containing protein n=1 Tax=Rehmannia glutinosa TaxID=99300 RepID=A0ABR0WD06_REHGL
MEEILTREKVVISSNEFIVGSVPTVFYIPDYVTAAEEDQLLNNIYQAPISKWKSLKNRRLQNWGTSLEFGDYYEHTLENCNFNFEEMIDHGRRSGARKGSSHPRLLLSISREVTVVAETYFYWVLVAINQILVVSRLPPWLKKVTCRIYEESRLFPSAINHVLINEYLPDQGIMPHQDGPAYLPVVAILSLGSPVVMNFVPHPRFENATETSGNNNEDIASNGAASTEMSSGEHLGEYLPFSVLLMPRSLLIFKDKAYSDYMHGIKDCADQRYDEAVNFTRGDEQSQTDGEDAVIHRTSTRVSLTCRLVTKVRKHLIKL